MSELFNHSEAGARMGIKRREFLKTFRQLGVLRICSGRLSGIGMCVKGKNGQTSHN